MSERSRPKILVVDDEARSTELLVRTLRRLGDVVTAASGEEGWEKFQADDFILVISDQRMSGMQGAQLLAQVAEAQPLTGRILLTGYVDLDATVAAVNEGRIDAYLHKPWSPGQVELSARTLLDRTALERENRSLLGVLKKQNEELEVAVSELRRVQHQLVNTERLSAIGRMVEVIAADLDQPIASLVSAAGVLARGDGRTSPEERLELAGIAYQHALGIERRCQELLELGPTGREGWVLDHHPLDEVLMETVGDLSAQAGACGVTIRTDLAFKGAVKVDLPRMRRVVRSLIDNALEAMPEGGDLRIRTEAKDDVVVLQVSDTGHGIPRQIRDVVFEPFVSAGKLDGRGLGLTLAKKVVEEHGGRVVVARSDESGTLVEIQLPVLDEGID